MLHLSFTWRSGLVVSIFAGVVTQFMTRKSLRSDKILSQMDPHPLKHLLHYLDSIAEVTSLHQTRFDFKNRVCQCCFYKLDLNINNCKQQTKSNKPHSTCPNLYLIRMSGSSSAATRVAATRVLKVILLATLAYRFNRAICASSISFYNYCYYYYVYAC